MQPIHAALVKRTPYTGILMFACLYACVVVHLSLFPYLDWRNIGIGPLEFLSGPWIPVHQTVLWTDIFVNIAGYVPLGLLMLLGLNRQPRTSDKLLVAVGCAALSLALESLQTYLPTRVPSKMDLLTNTMGGTLGVMLGSFFAKRRTLVPAMNRNLETWLIHRAWLGMGLLSLWFLSILAPQNPTFSTGLWLGNLFDTMGPALQTETPLGLPLEWILRVETVAPHFINYCFLMCAWLIGLAQTQHGSPRVRLLALLIAITLMLRMLDLYAQTPVNAFWYVSTLWFEQNSSGLMLAMAGALLMAWLPLPPHAMARLGLAHLLGGWLITLLLPGVHDPELDTQGGGLLTLFRTLQEAGRWVSELWPILALTVLGFLSQPERRFKR
ncbi:MAG TPA: VanZ family protein [Limnobacter sp.]|nr:VanZ family protein [Limnobacter sp.]